MRRLSHLFRSQRAAAGAEFALVLPLLLILIFGVIDGGRFLWEFNEAEKATQMGVRYAVVTDPVASALKGPADGGYSFSVSDGIIQGTVVPTANFDNASCNNNTCSCAPSGSGICGSIGHDATEFNRIVTRMAEMYAPIQASNVQVVYKNVGLGFAGDPDNPNVSSLVTVKLTGLTFQPLTCLVFACSISMPNFAASLTLEDASDNGQNPPIAN